MSKLFEQLLAARGVEPGFLNPKYEDLMDPDLLPDMAKAVSRIQTALRKQEKVLIYGDYDVDGVTASTILYDTLKIAGLESVEIMLPNRFLDGYGMSKKVVQKAIDDGVGLVCTVDCGSRNDEIIDDLMGVGIETVVTDHHECGTTLPNAVAIVNPKRKDVTVPLDLRNLCGAGVVFKLAQALVKAQMIPAGQEKWMLDLVALGTVCDGMRLTGENRRLCLYGLKVLEKTRRPGLRELMWVSGAKTLDSETLGFRLGPRLNAAGRMDTAEKALKLLMETSRPEAARMALELEDLNSERKRQQMSALEEIKKRGVGQNPVIIETGDWHEGVLGIIAGRLTEEYRKPAFVMSETGDALKGSGRSFGDFNLAEAIDACREYIIGGGGHAEACGVKIAKDKLPQFKQAMNQYYESLKLVEQERFWDIQEDLAVRNFDELSLEFLEELKKLEPYGCGNEEPVFLLPGVRVVEVGKLGAAQNHLRLVVWDQNGQSLKLMCFYAPEEYLALRGGETIDAWITLSENEFRGIRSVEGRIVKLK